MKIFIFALVLLLGGCSTASMWEGYNMRTMVKENSNRIYESIDSKQFEFENADLKVNYSPDITDAGTSFVFKNKTKKVIKIIWDEVAYIDPSGVSHPVFHSGVQISNRSAPKVPTIIIPEGTLSDDIISIDAVDWADNGWKYEPICGERSIYLHTLDDKNCADKLFSYFITYEIDAVKKNFTVKFKYLRSELKQEKKN